MTKYLEGEQLTDEEIQKAFCKGVTEGEIYPILCGSALTNKGINLLMDTICDYMPSPQDVPAEKGSRIRVKKNQRVQGR